MVFVIVVTETRAHQAGVHPTYVGRVGRGCEARPAARETVRELGEEAEQLLRRPR
jgi:hypothetical protein